MRFLVNVLDDRSSSGTSDEMAAIDAFNDRLRAGGHWVFAAGVADPSESVVVDARGPESVVTRGPFASTEVFVAGFWIIEAPDLDAARALMIDGSRACQRRLEIRPLHPAPAD